MGRQSVHEPSAAGGWGGTLVVDGGDHGQGATRARLTGRSSQKGWGLSGGILEGPTSIFHPILCIHRHSFAWQPGLRRLTFLDNDPGTTNYLSGAYNPWPKSRE